MSKNTDFGRVIEAVEAASQAELAELSGIRKAIDGLGGTPGKTKKNSEPVANVQLSGNKTSNGEQLNSDTLAERQGRQANSAFIDALAKISTPKSNNIAIKSRSKDNHTSGAVDVQQGPQSISRAKKNDIDLPDQVISPEKKQRDKQQPYAPQFLKAANDAYINKSKNSGSKMPLRDANGRFIRRETSADAAAREEARHQKKSHEGKEDGDEKGVFSKLKKLLSGVSDPSESQTGDAVGYALAGPLWSVGKEVISLSKEVGGGVTSATGKLSEIVGKDKDNKDGRQGRMSRIFGVKQAGSKDAINRNMQRQAIKETQDQTAVIEENDKEILKRLDDIAGNTKPKKDSALGKIATMLLGGGKKLLAVLGMKRLGGALGGKIFGGVGAKAGGVLGGILGGKFLSRFVKGKAVQSGESLAEGGAARLGARALGKGALRAIPLVGAIAGGVMDAVGGWKDKAAQQKTFGLSANQEPTFQQKASYAMGNVLDMGGLVSGISGALSSVFQSMGFTDIAKAMQFSTADIAKSINDGWTAAEAKFSDIAKSVESVFSEYTSKIGDNISSWFGDQVKDFKSAVDAIESFFTVENLKQVFSDAVDSLLHFVEHPVESVKNAAKSTYDAVKNSVGEKVNSVKHFIFSEDGKQSPAEKAISKVESVAASGLSEGKAVVSKIANSPAGKMAEKVSNTLGQASQAVATTGKSAVGYSNYQHAADTYNNGNTNVKINKLSDTGKAQLDSMAPYFSNLEKQYNLPDGTLYGLAATESGGNPNAVSQTGAKGMMQFTKIARKDVGLSDEQAWDPYASSEAAAKLLSKYNKQAGGNWNDTITAYNAGMGTVKNWQSGKGSLSKENREYAMKVFAHRDDYLGHASSDQVVSTKNGPQSALPSQGDIASQKPPTIDASTGIAYEAGDNPFAGDGIISSAAKFSGVANYAQQLIDSPAMRSQAKGGTYVENGRDVTSRAMESQAKVVPQSAVGVAVPVDAMASRKAPDAVQTPISQTKIDGRVISDHSSSGVKPTMQLADNTVSLDTETRRIFNKMVTVLERIEGHTEAGAKAPVGPTQKANGTQKGTDNTVPYFVDDPLMNSYASNS